ncbi:MAG: metal-dependent hydrolase [Anaerolineae bacterium]|nr:metal-dependent hydrolase [Anaerolineae bacterium]
MSIAITYHGHATFSLDIDGTKVVVDPFFAPNNPLATVKQEAISADYILQTHGHGDHIADTVPLAKRTGATVIANFEIVNWLGSKGVDNTHPMHIGGGYKHPFAHVKMTHAIHGSGLPDGSYGGNPGGFLLTTDSTRIYIAGDTALYSDMALTGAHGIDVAIIPIGDNFTMGPDDALLALGYLKPKVVIPCHYNTWPYIEVDVNGWADRVSAETDVKPIVMTVEQTYQL